MKRKSLLSVLFVAILALTVFAAAGCNNGKNQITPGPESGAYYCNTDNGDQYLLQLYNGNEFTLSVNSEIKSGNYVRTDNKLSLTFSATADGKIESTLENEILTLKYNNGDLRFYKSVMRTVTFNSNQGSTVNSITVLNGQPITKTVTPPTRQGYQFLGWYNADFTVMHELGLNIVTSNITLYAFWGETLPTQMEYIIDFDYNYTESPANPESVSTLGHKLYSVPTTPTREGYTFKGWWISMYNDRAKLTYPLNGTNTVFEESTTLFALWQANTTSSSKPLAPAVEVYSNQIKWVPVSGATSYKLQITDPNGTIVVDTSVTTASSSYAYDFPVMGDYIINVTSVGITPTDLSDVAQRYFKSHALARVSIFTVVNSSILVFNEVANAAGYLISIDCGNKLHRHKDMNIGNSTVYNFTNCEMQETGIKFTVSAYGNGFVSSESREYEYNKYLSEVTNFNVNETTQTASWNLVPNATNYLITVKMGSNSYTVNNGASTSYSLKEYNAGNMQIKILPQSAGYNSKESAWFSYIKTNLASPGSIRLEGKNIKWASVPGAANYTVKIGTLEFTAPASYDNNVEYSLTSNSMNTLQALSGDYELKIRANGTASSLYSDAVVVTNNMPETLDYFQGYASWKYVLGATKYSVKINNGVASDVVGLNYAPISFTQAGLNNIAITAIASNGAPINTANVKIFAYTVEFDGRNGDVDVNKIYKAFGDPVNAFPEPERTGYQLESWYTAPGGAAQNAGKYLATSFVGGDIVLYAYWTANNYKILLDAGEGTLTKNHGEAYFGDFFNLEVPAIEGNGFIGWFTTDGEKYTNENGMSGNTWIHASNEVTLYARYAEIFRFIGDGNTLTVTKGPDISLVTSLNIPDTYDGKPVVSVEDIVTTTIQNITLGKNIESIAMGALDGGKELVNINVDPENPYFTSINGVLYNKETLDSFSKVIKPTTLVRFPTGRTSATIPNHVVEIAENAFRNCNKITSITVPGSVNIINDRAFDDCSSLKYVTLTTGLTEIGYMAFANCTSLKEITFPTNLKTIDDNPLFNCTTLDTIRFAGGSSVPLTLGDSVFSDCYNLSDVIFEAGSMVQNITTYAFAGLVYLKSITIPASVTTIGNNVFLSCTNLKTVKIEANSMLANIGDGLFNNCNNLESVIFEGSTQLTALNNATFKKARTIRTLILPNGITTIAPDAFADCVSLTDITIPGTATNVSAATFTACTALENVRVTNSTGAKYSSRNGILYNAGETTLIYYPVAREGQYALPATLSAIEQGSLVGTKITAFTTTGNPNFSESGGVLFANSGKTLVAYPAGRTAAEYQVPAAVTKIEAYAFDGATALTSIIYSGNNLTIIGEYAFNGCSNLNTMELPGSITEIGYLAFNGCVKLTNLTLVKGAKTIDDGFFQGLTIDKFVVPKEIEVISANAFKNCANLTTLEFEEGSALRIIGNSAFQGCVSLESIILPTKLKEIGNYAFQGTGLTSISIPGSVEKLGNYAFQDTKLESVKFAAGDGALVMGTHVFNRLPTLTSLTFEEGSNVTNIGAYAFQGSSKLTMIINIPSSVKTIEEYAFEASFTGTEKQPTLYYAIEGIKGVIFNEGLVSIGTSAFQSCSFMSTIIDFPASLKTIGDNAFKDCYAAYSTASPKPGLTGITFKEGLVSIGDNAFYNIQTITNAVVIPSTVKTIGVYAFYYNKFSSLTFAGVDNNTSQLERINANAFQYVTTITSLVIPDSVTEIGATAFSGCSAINSLTISSALKTIPASAFYGFTALVNLIIPEGVEEIQQSAFYNIGTQSVNPFTIIIPASVKIIGPSAFYSTKVNAAEFKPGSKLTTIDSTSFYSYTLGVGASTVINVPSTLTPSQMGLAFNMTQKFVITDPNSIYSAGEDGVLYNKAGTTLVRYPAWRSGDYTVPAKVEIIGANAFQGAKTLKAVTFEAGSKLTTISDYAFACYWTVSGANVFVGNRCTITEITIPDSVTTIGKYAFQESTTLTTVTISRQTSKLESIGEQAFNNCNAITTITIPDSLKNIGNGAYSGCTKIVTANIDNDRKDFVIENLMLIDKTIAGRTIIVCGVGNITGIFIVPETILNIGDYAFQGRTGITSLVIHKNVISIGKYAFSGCTGITSITFEEGSTLSSIGDYAFNGCNKMAGKLSLPASLTTISDYAFSQSTFTSVEIQANSNLRSIGSYGFGNTNITNINLPSKLTSIGTYAFTSTKLTSITIPASVTSMGTNAFTYISSMKSITFENGSQLKNIPANAFNGCSGLTKVDFGTASMLSYIDNGAFIGCSTLADITIPAQVSAFGTRVFESCTALQEFKVETSSTYFTVDDGIIFDKSKTTLVLYPTFGKVGATYVVPSTVKTIGKSAFAGSGQAKLKEVVLNEGITKLSYFAFYGLSRAISIPYSVQVIESGTFDTYSQTINVIGRGINEVPAGWVNFWTGYYGTINWNAVAEV